MNFDYCQNCGVSFIGDPIPEEHQHLYGATHFRREIGIEDPFAYDGVLMWRCPDCGYEWSHFGKGLE